MKRKVLFADGDALDLVMERRRQAVRDGRAGGIRGFEVFFIKLLIEGAVRGIAEVVASLDDVGQVAAGVMQDLDQIFHGAAEFLLKSAGDDLARFVHRGLAGDENQIAKANGRAEGQVRNGSFRSAWVFDFRHGI